MAAATTTRMLVLGVVSIFEPANGYQIRRELLSWGVEQWADLKTGSVYSMLATLTKQGLIVRHDLLDAGRRVAVYALSPAGRAEFEQLVATALDGSRGMDRKLFQVAMNFAPFLPRARVVAGLQSRIARADEALHDVRAKITGAEPIPPHVLRFLTFDVSLLETEINWLRDLVTSIEAGALVFLGEPGGWSPPPEDSGWEMTQQSKRYREQIAALSQ